MVEMTDKVMAVNGGQLPTIAAGEDVTMTLHQINQDGAGPYACDISSDGGDFMMMAITSNVPGVAGLSAATVRDYKLVAKVPAEMKSCSGGSNGATCIIRCRNAAIAGPFGGCMAAMMEGQETFSEPTKRSLRSVIEFGSLEDEHYLFRRAMPSPWDIEDDEE